MNIIELMKVVKVGDKVKCKLHGGQTEIATVRVTARDKDLILDDEWEDCIESCYSLYHLLDADYEIIKPKYYLKHKWIGNGKSSYLNYDDWNDQHIISNKFGNESFCTKFTLDEIEEIKKKFDTNLEDFKLEKVEE